MNKLPRLLIAAPQSGSGKTTIVSGLLAALKRRGFSVQPFKVGPDYIDAGYHEAASGRRCHSLDTWLTGAEAMKSIFAGNAEKAGISVIEGVMGFYDGGRGGISSTAEIAKLLKTPVVLVIDVRSMGESAAALVRGFRDYDGATDIRGVILNRLGSESHRQIICEAMEKIGMPVLGSVFRDERLSLPSRHLGLLPRSENSHTGITDIIRDAAVKSLDLEELVRIAESSPELAVKQSKKKLKTNVNVKIGVALDEAFSFYYPESLAVIENLGAELVYFSPLNDRELPRVSGLIFGGGFPEVFAARLAANGAMLAAVRRAAGEGMPIYAECGGYMYLTRELRDFNGESHRLAGIIPQRTVMNERLQTVGYVTAVALRDTVLCPAGSVIRGHEFHFSSIEGEGVDENTAFKFYKNRTGAEYKAGYASDNILASYLHLHFAGTPDAAENFVLKCGRCGAGRQ